MTATNTWGVGLRPQHLSEWQNFERLPPLEVLVEHFAYQQGGPHWAALMKIKDRADLALHGLNLNIGGYDPLDLAYLDEIKRLCSILKPSVYSDHLAFSQWDQKPTFDLLPVPFTLAQQVHIIERVHQAQDYLGQQLALENISAYVAYPDDAIPELEFLQGVADRTGCGILLDLNNLFVNAHNFNFDAHAALRSLDAHSILQYHVSGHQPNGRLLHDTHDQTVIPEVWDLLYEAETRFGKKTLILERDDADISLQEIFADLAAGRRHVH